MRVYYIGTARRKYYPLETAGELRDLQALVDGYIEVVHIPEFEEQGITLLANEQGVLHLMALNWNLLPYFYVGPVVALSVEGEEFVGLSDMQADFIKQWLDNTN